jgi:hypothetical protein
MEEGKKKTILIAVIVVCLGSAGAITFFTRSGSSAKDGLAAMKRGTPQWLKCRNPDCEAEYTMDQKDYFTALRDNQDPMSMVAPALVCNECSEESIYGANKCEKCEIVSELNSVPGDFSDRCPECKYSKIEARRKELREQRRRGGK